MTAQPTDHDWQKLHIEPEMVLVPAGSFLMGTTDEQIQVMVRHFDWAKRWEREGWFGREQPQHRVMLPTFEIGRYPITNAEFKRFLDDGGYRNRSYWTDAGWKQKEEQDWRLPRFWDDKYNAPSHPVAGVSWYEAFAYCAWLAAKTDRPYRLPTEAEWEKAARGTDGRIYSWGNDWDATRCNTRESSSGETSPVGHFSPAGDSPYGVADIMGNVQEWCSSLDKPYPYQASDGREDLGDEGYRVLRGSSWFFDRDLARCAARDFAPPAFHNYVIGFRIVLAPALPS